MPITSFQEIIKDAFSHRYGIGAFNIVDGLSMQAVLHAAEEANSPVILQTSVKTVQAIGPDVLFAMWAEMAKKVRVPACLHLDHCADRTLISTCLAAGWGSVLFDASRLPLAENRRQTIEVVAEAKRFGAGVEGEIEPIHRVEEIESQASPGAQNSLQASLDFIAATGIDCFAPAIGNAHGLYKDTPHLNANLITDIATAHPIPMALHGGTGLSDDQFRDLIARGCAKVNISTALKMNYMQSSLGSLKRQSRKLNGNR